MLRRELLKRAIPLAVAGALPAEVRAKALPSPAAAGGRAAWLLQLQRVASPVLESLAAAKLKANMPVECAPGMESNRRHTTYLEAVGRLLSGIAPWLEHGATTGSEGELRTKLIALVHQALAVGLDPSSPDKLDFTEDRQNLVDAAFLSLAVLRAPRTLCASLSARIRTQLVANLRGTRKFSPPFSNWLLFSACIEAALHALGEDWDRMRVDYALREHTAWYVGDGVYGDGPHFHADYYDSFVIHPFLLAVLNELGHEDPAWVGMLPLEQKRAQRYAAIQERMIAPDGTYPVVGRSITYRCGAFHALADMALKSSLPESTSPEQVRCALESVIARTLGAPGTFDANGWLQIGLAGHQPPLGENYISTGSLYLCAEAFLPLGLQTADRFWTAPDAPWTSRKVWSGANLAADHAIES